MQESHVHAAAHGRLTEAFAKFGYAYAFYTEVEKAQGTRGKVVIGGLATFSRRNAIGIRMHEQFVRRQRLLVVQIERTAGEPLVVFNLHVRPSDTLATQDKFLGDVTKFATRWHRYIIGGTNTSLG